LVKRGNFIKLYEVKAKSIDLTDNSFLTKNGNKILANWKPYLFDIAFQRYVVRCAFPELIVTSYLYLVDENTSDEYCDQIFDTDAGSDSAVLTLKIGLMNTLKAFF